MLRAHSILLKPNTFVGVFQPKGAQRTNFGPRFCSGGRDNNMDKQPGTAKNTGDVMSNSFGEAYATRSDEEGFGGIYSDTQQLKNGRKESNENSTEYDRSQGSEVKEKEKGRNQHKDSACN